MSSDSTRVLIVDDHPMVAEGIQSILESFDDINVVGTLGSGQGGCGSGPSTWPLMSS